MPGVRNVEIWLKSTLCEFLDGSSLVDTPRAAFLPYPPLENG